MSAGGSRPNAYRCADCGHHEITHKGGPCALGILGDNPCDCTLFIPGACETCAGFGCAECEKESRRR